MTPPEQPAEPVAVDITVTAGRPNAVELAAVTAVLSAALEELAEESRRVEHAGPSAWQRSQRPLRGAITPGHGQWRGFSG